MPINLKENLIVCVNGTSNWTTILPYYALFRPANIEKLNPPINIKVSMESEYPKIEWEPPVTLYKIRPRCFVYQVKITNLKMKSTEIKNASNPVFVMYNFDPSMAYLLQVRTRRYSSCADANFWSDWSQSASIGQQEEQNFSTINIILMALISFFVVVLMVLLKRYHLFQKLFPPIPDSRNKMLEFLETWSWDYQHAGLQHVLTAEENFATVEER
nr:PREDICTED: interleukin-5 receptor subunit alpha-like [Latimeria chalumnae]|eukprot:XP_005997263.2 PREDICTED: interleukin-5 receptor subunit alpha-like [Latimeria chalumnae]